MSVFRQFVGCSFMILPVVLLCTHCGRGSWFLRRTYCYAVLAMLGWCECDLVTHSVLIFLLSSYVGFLPCVGVVPKCLFRCYARGDVFC